MEFPKSQDPGGDWNCGRVLASHNYICFTNLKAIRIHGNGSPLPTQMVEFDW